LFLSCPFSRTSLSPHAFPNTASFRLFAVRLPTSSLILQNNHSTRDLFENPTSKLRSDAFDNRTQSCSFPAPLIFPLLCFSPSVPLPVFRVPSTWLRRGSIHTHFFFKTGKRVATTRSRSFGQPGTVSRISGLHRRY
jgi:hypothetical protein